MINLLLQLPAFSHQGFYSASAFSFYFLSCTRDPSIPVFIVEKNQLIKQKNSSAGRRGEKRNSKHKNKCDSFSLKNGLVGFSSTAGGNNFFGMAVSLFTQF